MPLDLPDDLLDSFKELNKGFEEFKSKNDAHLEEVKKGFDDVVRKDELEKLQSSMDENQKKMDEFGARMQKLADNPDPSTADEAELNAKADAWAKANAFRRNRPMVEDFTNKDLEEYKKSFNIFLREFGTSSQDVHEKALSVGRDPDGGFTVTPDMSGRMVMRIFETSPVRQHANVQSINTDALEGTSDFDEIDANWVAESEARPETNTPKVGKWRIPVHEMYANPRITQKLLDDTSVDIEAWLANKVSDKMSRIQNDAFVNGDGVGKPRGFLTYPLVAGNGDAARAHQYGQIRKFDAPQGGFVGSGASGTHEQKDVLLDAIYSLKTQYRQNAVWAMNRLTLNNVRQIKDEYGQYIWQPGMQAGAPSMLFMYSVAMFEDMPDLASGTTTSSIAIADWNATYQIVDRIGIRVLIDPFSSKPFLQYYTTCRVGGDVLNFDSIAVISFST